MAAGSIKYMIIFNWYLHSGNIQVQSKNLITMVNVQTKVSFVWAWLTCQTFSSSYSSIHASTWSGLKPLDVHCSITSLIFTVRPPFTGTISLMTLNIWSTTFWVLWIIINQFLESVTSWKILTYTGKSKVLWNLLTN